MAEQAHPLQPERIDRVAHVHGEALDLVAVLGLVGLAVPAHVEGDDTTAGRKLLHLGLELRGGLRPAGDHDEGRAAALLHVVKADSVICRDMRHGPVSFSNRPLRRCAEPLATGQAGIEYRAQEGERCDQDNRRAVMLSAS